MTGPTLKIPSDGDRGRGDYAAYHALWHLKTIGVLADLQDFASDGWDAAAARLGPQVRRTRVALIDVSVAAGHPNLKDAVDTDLAIDFFAARLGIPATPDAVAARVAGHGGALPADLPATVGPLWAELTTHLGGGAADPHASVVQPATSPSFSAHGTAMAGLIGARPVAPDAIDVAPVRLFDPASGTFSDLPAGTPTAFAYAGVDPFCEIVPISTNFDPEPEQLILSLLYAALIGADVIVLARDFPSPDSLAPGVAPTAEALGRALRVGLTEEEMTLWSALKDLTLALSRRVPIVCAAGNGALDGVLFPGALAAPDNGIIAVGARAATGQPAAYTPVGPGITVQAPSGDGERLDRDLQRLDTQSGRFNPQDQSAAYTAGLGNYGDPAFAGVPAAGTHAPQDLVSTDVPGRAGYNSSPHAQVFGRDGAVLDYRSAFCRFSGTSGATALTAGLLSLAISAGRIAPGAADFGVTAKAALRGSGAGTAAPLIHWSHFPPPPPEETP